MTLSASPWGLLQGHVHSIAGATALVHSGPEGLTARTWADVGRRVERAVAALLRVGLSPGQVVLVLASSGPDVVELEMAVRVAGAVPVHVAAGLGGPELRAHLDGVDIRLVVVDHHDQLDALEGCDLSGAEVLVLDGGPEWDRLQALGETELVVRPTLVEDVAEDPDATWPEPLALVRLGAGVFLLRLPAEAAAGLPEVVVLGGVGSDHATASSRARHLVTGGCLAWTTDLSELLSLVRDLRPTRLDLSASAATHLAAVMTGADPEVVWESASVDAVGALVVASSGGALARGARRRRHAVDRLRADLGSQLATITVGGPPPHTLVAVARGLHVVVETEDVRPVYETLPLAPVTVPLEVVGVGDPRPPIDSTGPVRTLVEGDSFLERLLAGERTA